MIDFTGKTYFSILKAMLDQIPNTYDKRDTSPIPTALGPAAYALEGFYLSLDKVQKEAFVQTAVGQSLDYLAAIAGLSRYQASKAVRLGVFNLAVPLGARFSTVNGADSINFTVTAATSTETAYQLTAETAGSIGNDYSGPILPITAIPGLSSAELTDILVPGDDEETDEALRERVLTALNERPFGGNLASYRTDIANMDGVGGVQVYPTWNGGGTVKCSILGADFLPASQTLVQNVQAAIDPPANQGQGLGLAPIGATVSVTAPSTVTIQIAAGLVLAPGYTIEQVQPLVEAAIESYMLEIRQGWDLPLSETAVEYAANVYHARVLAAIVGLGSVVNVTGLQLNGAAADVLLTQSGTIQQVPILGEVALHV